MVSNDIEFNINPIEVAFGVKLIDQNAESDKISNISRYIDWGFYFGERIDGAKPKYNKTETIACEDLYLHNELHYQLEGFTCMD